ARRGRSAAPLPVTLAITVAVACLHLAALGVMAQGGVDAYVIYGYPTIVVLSAALAAWACTRAEQRWGKAAASRVALASIALALAVHRPDALSWGFGAVERLWRDRAGAACSWRFAEGFLREQEYGLAPAGRTREEHAIERCRSLSEPPQVLDCIGGIARELNWRQDGRVQGEPPAGLDAEERRAYAYHWGTHRRGDVAPCGEFAGAALAAQCAAAVRLECLTAGDLVTRFTSGRAIGRPRCVLAGPPMDGYWAAMRRDLIARTSGEGPDLTFAKSLDTDLGACQPVFDECYGSSTAMRRSPG
ncbi:MAG TPA: hypothetical protein VLF14_00020, partial [Candidatus Binatia bacterium]|nr:hypothetical protein [Candidatus Binatia bacterium]